MDPAHLLAAHMTLWCALQLGKWGYDGDQEDDATRGYADHVAQLANHLGGDELHNILRTLRVYGYITKNHGFFRD